MPVGFTVPVLPTAHSTPSKVVTAVWDSLSFKAMFEASQELLDKNLIEAMHDISDGGLITSLIEMALCSNQGLNIDLDYSDKEQIIPKLFSEEAGLVIEVNNEKLEAVKKYLNKVNDDCT